MKKYAMLAAMTLAAFVATIPLAHAGGMEKSSAMIKARSEYVGALVRNLQDEKLGTVRDIATDSEGNVSFVIVSHGGFLGYKTKETAIPFEALTYSAGLREFVIDLSKERLDSSPRYVRGLDLNDHGSAGAFYRFYGIAPPWGEMKGEDSMQHEPMMHDQMKDEPMMDDHMKDDHMQGEPMGQVQTI